MAYWLTWAKRNVAPVTSGSYTEGRWKLLIHTTESSRFTPSPSSYFGHSGWPHLTNERDGTLWQHIDLHVAARALKNLPGGVQTNRSRVIQVENVGFAADGNNALTDAQIANLRRLVLELHQEFGMELQALAPWPVAGSARVNAPQRMSTSAWRTYSGIVAHANAPENDHWDSGGFDLRRLLPAPAPPVEEEDMIRLGDSGTHVRNFQFVLNRFFTDTGGPPASNAQQYLVKDGVAGDATFAVTFEALQRLAAPEPGFALTAQLDLLSNGVPNLETLRSEGINAVIVAAITSAAAVR